MNHQTEQNEIKQKLINKISKKKAIIKKENSNKN